VGNAKEKIETHCAVLERNGHMSENYFEQILGGDDAESIEQFVDRHPNDILSLARTEKQSGPGQPTEAPRTMSERNDIVLP